MSSFYPPDETVEVVLESLKDATSGEARVVAIFPHDSTKDFPSTAAETEAIKHSVTAVVEKYSVALWTATKTPEVGDTVDFVERPEKRHLAFPEGTLNPWPFRGLSAKEKQRAEVEIDGKLALGEERPIVILTSPTFLLSENSGVGNVVHVEKPGPFAATRATAWAEEYAESKLLPCFTLSLAEWFDPDKSPEPKRGQFVAHQHTLATPLLKFFKLDDHFLSLDALTKHGLEHGRSNELWENLPNTEVVLRFKKVGEELGIGTVVEVFTDPDRRPDMAIQAAVRMMVPTEKTYFHAFTWVDREEPKVGRPVEYDLCNSLAAKYGGLDKLLQNFAEYEKAMESIRERAERPRLAVIKQLEQPEQELDRERDRGLGR